MAKPNHSLKLIRGNLMFSYSLIGQRTGIKKTVILKYFSSSFPLIENKLIMMP